eukprot:1219596-Amphidinium_carterae.1
MGETAPAQAFLYVFATLNPMKLLLSPLQVEPLPAVQEGMPVDLSGQGWSNRPSHVWSFEPGQSHTHDIFTHVDVDDIGCVLNCLVTGPGRIETHDVPQ